MKGKRNELIFCLVFINGAIDKIMKKTLNKNILGFHGLL
jgi:hypothetical protein